MNSKIRNKTLYLGSRLISILGNQILVFIIAIYVLEQTGSALSYAFTLSISIVTALLCAPFAGVFSDSLNRKKILITFNLLSGVCLLWFSKGDNILIHEIYICLIAISICGSFYDIASESIKINIVDKQEIIKLNVWAKGIDSLSRIMTPIMAAGLYNKVSIIFFFRFDAITFLLAAVMDYALVYSSIKVGKEKQLEKKESFINKWKNAFSYLNHNKKIIKIIILFIIFNITFSIESSVAVPYLLLNYYKLTVKRYSIIEMVISIGLLCGAACSIYLMGKNIFSTLSKLSIGFVLIFTNIIIGIILYDFNILNINWIFGYLLLFMALFGVFISLLEIPVQSYVQCNVAEEYMGRVITTITTIVKVVNPIVYILGGLMIDNINLVFVFFIGIVLLLISIIVNRRWKVEENGNL